jgi:hypothetical protein
MKKYIPGLLFCLLTLLLCACTDINISEESEFDYTNVGTIQSFWARDLSTLNETPYSVYATLQAENDQCLVYVQNNSQGNATITRSVAEAIAQEYSRNIEPKITGAFGQILHISGKNKITFLLLDIRDGYAPNKGGYVAGYFDPRDMEQGFFSNGRDMLYIDTNPGLTDMDGLYSTVAHELQHLISYSVAIKTGREQELWINEGLSTAAEYIYGGDPVNRVALYNEDRGNTIAYGNNFFVWYGYWELVVGDSLANYSTAYLFFQWLRLHGNNGIGIYKDIINSPFADYRALTDTAQRRIPALGLTGSSEKDWETLLQTWMLANMVQAPNGLLGYQNKIGEITGGKVENLVTTYFYGTTKDEWAFYPGEGIFTQLDISPYTPPAGSGPHIRYVGFGSEGFDRTSPYEGQFLLTFNANWDNRAVYPSGDDLLPGEPGYLAGVLQGPAGEKTFGGMRSVREDPGASTRPFSYPVDAGFLRERQKWEKSRASSGGAAYPGEE